MNVRAPIERMVLKRLLRNTTPSLVERSVSDAFQRGEMTARQFCDACAERFPQEASHLLGVLESQGIDPDAQARVLLARFKHGFKYKEYVAFGFDRLPEEQWGTYIADSGRAALECGLNRDSARSVLIDKRKTYRVYRDAYKREQAPAKGMSLRAFCAFAERNPAFVVKNRTGSRGHGFTRVDDAFSVDLKDFYKRNVRGADAVLEAVIRQSEQLSRFNVSSVNTVRIVCFNGAEGFVTPFCVLRMGIGGSVVDNASAGGIFVEVDPFTGRICGAARSHSGLELAVHPDSGLAFEGCQLPDWAQLRQLVRDCTERVGGMGYVGWDLAHTNDGWVIVEGNCGAGLVMIQVALGRGVKAQVSRLIAGMDVPLGKDVLYALAAFG